MQAMASVSEHAGDQAMAYTINPCTSRHQKTNEINAARWFSYLSALSSSPVQCRPPTFHACDALSCYTSSIRSTRYAQTMMNRIEGPDGHSTP